MIFESEDNIKNWDSLSEEKKFKISCKFLKEISFQLTKTIMVVFVVISSAVVKKYNSKSIRQNAKRPRSA